MEDATGTDKEREGKNHAKRDTQIAAQRQHGILEPIENIVFVLWVAVRHAS